MRNTRQLVTPYIEYSEGWKLSRQGAIVLTFNPSVPGSLIWVGSPWRPIGAFRPLRRDCARLMHRIISWIVWKRSGVGFSIIIWSWNIFQITIKKSRRMSWMVSNYDRKNAARYFDTIHDILRRLSLPKSALKVENSKVCDILANVFFELWENVWFERCSSFILWYKNWRPTFWHYPKHPTRRQSRVISSQMLKCANLFKGFNQ